MLAKAELRQKLLEELESQCQNLPLCQVPTDIVMGHGNVESKVMFIGEAPGENEAIQRKPFVGRAGKLLDKTLGEVGIPREQVYISNIVKVRPPNNRDPLPEEISAFTPYLLKEIEIIQPQLFVTLGRFAMNYFLPNAKISAVHGVLQRFWWNGKITYLLPQYHPAAALRGTAMLQAFQVDMAKIPKALTYVHEKIQHDEHVEAVRQAIF